MLIIKSTYVGLVIFLAKGVFEVDSVVLLSFLGAAILLTLMPGPDILFVIAQSLSQNARAGITTALGLCTGLLVHISAAIIGISAIIYSSATVFTVVKFAGAAYLMYLAFCAFRAPASSISWSEKPAIAYTKLYKKGIIMNILNPKVSIFFLALLPQFVQGNDNVSGQMLLLGLIFLVQAFFIFSIVSLLAGQIGRWLLKSALVSKYLTKIEGTIYAIIGASIAFSKQ